MTEQHGGGDAHDPAKAEIVTLSYAADLDRKQVKESIDEMHPEADFVRVYDRTTARDIAIRGERPQFVCPECGREAYSVSTSGGERVYSHGLDDKCRSYDDDWEPPRGHTEEDVSLKTRVRRAIPHVAAFGIVLAVALGIATTMPSGTITINGETTAFPPEYVIVPVLTVVGLGSLIAWAIQYAPGRVGGRGGGW